MLKWLSGILTTVLSGWILHDRLLHRLRSWSWHFLNSDISQGSVATQLRCGEIISQGFVANLLVNLSVKEIWKSVNIWRSYGEYCSALFFWLTVYIKRGNGGRGQLRSEWGQNENDVIMRTGAASAVGARRHNENDVTMTIAGLWRYGDWRHVATGCTALVHERDVSAWTV